MIISPEVVGYVETCDGMLLTVSGIDIGRHAISHDVSDTVLV